MAVRDEPMDKWEDIGGRNLLKMYYEDPKKWAFVFQTQVLLTLGEQICELQSELEYTIVTVRSLESSVEIFARNLYEKEIITKVEFETLQKLSKKLEPQCCKENHNHVFVYLRCIPEIAIERVKKRGQTGDIKITFDDLVLLHEKHEAYIETLTRNLVIIDVNESSTIDQIVDEIFKKLIPILVKDVEEP